LNEDDKNQLVPELEIKDKDMRRSREFVLKTKKLRDKIDFDQDIKQRAYIHRNSKNPRLHHNKAIT